MNPLLKMNVPLGKSTLCRAVNYLEPRWQILHKAPLPD